MSGAGRAAPYPTYHMQRRKWLRDALPAIIVTLVVAAIVVPPVIVPIETSLREPEGTALTIANYAGLFKDPRLYLSAWNSISFSALAMLLSLVNGGLVAWHVERTNVPFKSLATISAIISLGTPYTIEPMLRPSEPKAPSPAPTCLRLRAGAHPLPKGRGPQLRVQRLWPSPLGEKVGEARMRGPWPRVRSIARRYEAPSGRTSCGTHATRHDAGIQMCAREALKIRRASHAHFWTPDRPRRANSASRRPG